MKTRIKSLIILLSICSCINILGQNKKLDSLRYEYKKAKHDTTRIKLYLDIGYLYESINPDSSILIYNRAIELVNKNLVSSNTNTHLRNTFFKQKSASLQYIGIVYDGQGNYDKALVYYLKSLKIGEELSSSPIKTTAIKGKKVMSSCFISIGNVHINQGNYEKAMEYYLKALKVNEELGDKKGTSHCYGNIGTIHLCQGNYDKAIENYLKSLKISEELGDKKGVSTCYGNIGNVNADHGNYNKAIEYYLKSLKMHEELGDKIAMSKQYNNIGTIYCEQGSYEKAMEYYLKALKIKEELGDKKGMSKSYNNIGLVYKEQGSYDKALEYYLKALKIAEESGGKHSISSCYGNIGIIFKEQGNNNKALEYYLKALKIAEELDDKMSISIQYYNIGSIYNGLGINDKAMTYFLKSLKICEELGDKSGIAFSYLGMAYTNSSLTDSADLNESLRLNYLNKAIEYGVKAIKLAQEINAIPLENGAAKTLMSAYKKLGNFKKTFEYAEIFIATKDSMFSEEKTKALAQMEAKYQNEKKQKEIELLNKNKEIQQIELRRQTTQKYAFICGFLLMLVLAFVSYRSFRQKKKANRLLTEKNERIEAQKTEIEAQRNLAAEQRDLITEQKKDITDSINSAFRIQSALIPQEEYISSFLSNYFILYKPRDIVSGDFYWIDKKGSKLIIIAADCTGHGVPGAFMSMLGVAFINEIVNKENITSPADILNKLRDILIKSLKQSGKLGESKEGMDIAALTIDLKPGNLNLQFAGANNPLYVISSVILCLQKCLPFVIINQKEQRERI